MTILIVYLVSVGLWFVGSMIGFIVHSVCEVDEKKRMNGYYGGDSLHEDDNRGRATIRRKHHRKLKITCAKCVLFSLVWFVPVGYHIWRASRSVVI